MLSKTQHRYFRPRAAQPQTLLYCNHRNGKAAPPVGKSIVNTARYTRCRSFQSCGTHNSAPWLSRAAAGILHV